MVFWVNGLLAKKQEMTQEKERGEMACIGSQLLLPHLDIETFQLTVPSLVCRVLPHDIAVLEAPFSTEEAERQREKALIGIHNIKRPSLCLLL